MDFYTELLNDEIDSKVLAERAVKDPSFIPSIWEGLVHEKATVRFGCQKTLLEISKTNPDLTYPFFDAVMELLTHKNNIFVWSALLMIGNLASVDSWNKLDFHLPEILKKLNTGKMITANNATEALGKVAVAKPHLAKKVVEELLKTENYKYDTKECHNILLGRVIDAFSLIYESVGSIPLQDKVEVFTKKLTSNTRKSTRERAEKLLLLMDRKEALTDR